MLERLFWAALLVVFAIEPASAAPVVPFITAAAAFLSSPIGQAVTFAVVSGIRYLLAKRAQQNAEKQEAPGVQIPDSGGVQAKRRVYGTYCHAGGKFDQRSTFATTGGNLETLLIGRLLSEGPCDGNAVESLIINGVECPLDSQGHPLAPPWNNQSTDNFGDDYFALSYRAGLAGQLIDPIVADLFDENEQYRQRGIAAVVVKLSYGADPDEHVTLWGNAAEPSLLFKHRGVRLYDPRDASQDADDSDTWVWSDNATLCQVDYMRSRMGFELTSADIDWASVRAAANIDDRLVLTAGGSYEARGRINGVVLSTENNADVLDAMRLANRATIQKIAGKWTWRIDEARDPVATIGLRHLIGDLSFQNAPDKRSLLNTVRAVFYPASKFNARAETIYQDAGAFAADGVELPASPVYRFIDSPSAAQRLGYAAISDTREGRFITGLFDISVIIAAGKPNQYLAADDVIRLAFHDNYSELNGLYQVKDIEIGFDFTARLTLAGYNPATISGWSSSLETEFEAEGG